MRELVHCCDEAATHQLPIAADFWIIQVVSMELMQICCPHSLSHFEWDSYTVHILNPRHLLPPMTTAVKLSLFTHVHSNPLSLAPSYHGCCVNRSRYINNGWTFSGQFLKYIYTHIYTHIHTLMFRTCISGFISTKEKISFRINTKTYRVNHPVS